MSRIEDIRTWWNSLPIQDLQEGKGWANYFIKHFPEESSCLAATDEQITFIYEQEGIEETLSSFKEVYGDLITRAYAGEFDLIAHGCNCQKTMGTGIAAQIRKRINEAYRVDQEDTREPIRRLGDLTISVPTMTSDCNFRVLNLYTQFNPGRNLDYDALVLSLRKVNHIYGGKKIGLPQIGCGIAGGDWMVVKDIIKRELKDMKVTIVHYGTS